MEAGVKRKPGKVVVWKAKICYSVSMNLTLTVKPKTSRGRKKFIVEMDADKLERMAAAFGLFNPEFLESVERAEEDYRHGRVRTIRSLRELM